MIDWPASQRLLGVTPDGKPGPNTYAAIVAAAGQPCQPCQPCQPVASCLAKYAAEYGMTTAPRLAEFVAQIANETGGFTRWEENLGYRAETLVAQWPTHFTPAQAAAAVRNPIEIASRAYGGRMGNASYPSRDGYTYRGRGALQLTGKAAYAKFGQVLGLDLVAHPEIAADPFNSTLIALEFFKELGVNAAVDAGDFVKARRLTNGGSIGLDNVARLRGKILAKLI
jgi:putative chitinase